MEFLKSGPRDCPLIRLYEFNAGEARHLRRIALQLARGQNQVVSLHEEPGMLPIGGCQLTLRRAEKNRGVFEIASSKFEWIFNKSGWLTVAGLIRPFSRCDAGAFQWLSSVGKVEVLLSRDGRW